MNRTRQEYERVDDRHAGIQMQTAARLWRQFESDPMKKGSYPPILPAPLCFLSSIGRLSTSLWPEYSIGSLRWRGCTRSGAGLSCPTICEFLNVHPRTKIHTRHYDRTLACQ